MSTIKDFFRWLFAGIISSALLAVLFVLINMAATVRHELVVRNRDIVRLRQQIQLLENEYRECRKTKSLWDRTLRDTSAWRNPGNKVYALYRSTAAGYDGLKKQFDLVLASTELSGRISFGAGDYLLECFRKNLLRYWLYALFLVFLGPVLWKICFYYLVARIVENRKPVCLLPNAKGGNISVSAVNVALEFPLTGDERLFLRAGDWGKIRTNLQPKTRFMWNWRYPLVSAAADLLELVELKAMPGTAGSVIVTSPEPDIYIGQVDLHGDEGMVIRSRHIVGVTGDIKIRTRWSFKIHNLISGRVRQVILYGHGSVLVAGNWGIDSQQYQPEKEHKIEDNLIIGYETGAEYSLCRTETFWHYLRNSATLFDLRISKGVFFTQNNASHRRRQETLFESICGSVLSGLGNFLGY